MTEIRPVTLTTDRPEIREQLGVQKTLLTNDFWSWFSNCAIFNCCLELSQLYYQKDGLYRFSKSFSDHFEDLGNWNYHGAMKMRFPAVFGQISVPRWPLAPAKGEEAVEYHKEGAEMELVRNVQLSAGVCSEVGDHNITWPSQFSFA